MAKSEDITVQDEDIEAKINEIAAARGETATDIRAYIEKEEAMPVLNERIVEEKTLDWLFDNCNLVAPETLSEAEAAEEASEADTGDSE